MLVAPVGSPYPRPMTRDARLSPRLDLAGGSEHTREDWERAAAAVLRKARRLGEDAPDHDVWDALTRTTLDGLRVPPLGTPELVADLPAPVRPPARDAGWDVRAWLADADPTRGNASLLTDLENGATSLLVQVGAGGTAPDDLARLLDGVLLDVAAVVLDAPSDPLGAARALAAVAQGVEAPLAAGTNLGVDVVAARLRGLAEGRSREDDEEVLREAAATARGLGCRAFVVDGTALHDLGASDVQEVGHVLATAVHLLRTLEAAGTGVDEAVGLVEFRLAATDQQLLTIAKLRAVRRLWARVLELSGAAPDRRQMVLHAMTSRPMMTRYDPWVNQLRTCVAAFSAGVGGADAVTVLPFDSRLGVPDAFGRRIARNTSTLLVEESHVARVADPAGGAFAVERLTDDLAHAAWEELGRVEAAGGVHAALADGSLHARVAEVVAERDRRVATRDLPLTGTSEFPHLGEVLPEREPYAEGAYAVRPYAEPFEQLRDDPATTPVFLATMGTVAAHTARATFATNLLAAGGVVVVNTGAHDDVAAVVADYTGEHGGQPVVCVVGHDKAYDAWGADLAAALREAGATRVVVAGKPRDWADDSCALGVDALDFLRRTREDLR